ncbi:MAG: hypothetical protein KDA59_22775 [Planctomycetales bacterium]|nr:hypothetical protein [Planctomycetales bacterium]
MKTSRSKLVTPTVGLFRRIAKSLGWCLAVLFSLLVFPSVLAWTIAAWVISGIGRRSLDVRKLAVAACLPVAKGIDWRWDTVALVVVLVSVIVAEVVRRWRCRRIATDETEAAASARRASFPRQSMFATGALCVSLVVFLYCDWRAVHASRAVVWNNNRPIVCLGDSLTAYGYPESLGERLPCPVINFGTDGITTEAGLARLPQALAHDPQAVVLELGGHDFLRHKPRAETKRRLQTLIDRCRQHGAEVILVEVPRGFIRDPYGGLERELARENDLRLVPDSPIRWCVLLSPFAPPGMWLARERHLSDDGLHPNERGNRLLARYVAQAVNDVFVASR